MLVLLTVCHKEKLHFNPGIDNGIRELLTSLDSCSSPWCRCWHLSSASSVDLAYCIVDVKHFLRFLYSRQFLKNACLCLAYESGVMPAAFQDILPCLELMCEAFPPLCEDVTCLLLQLGRVCRTNVAVTGCPILSGEWDANSPRFTTRPDGRGVMSWSDGQWSRGIGHVRLLLP